MATKRILIVEDDELLREMYTLKLELEGFEVEVAENGLKGFEKASTQHFDLILLDNLMPYMSGLDLLRKLKLEKQDGSTKVIMFSNKSSQPEISLAKKLGASDYLIKSQHTPHWLVQKIRKLLGSTEPNEALRN